MMKLFKDLKTWLYLKKKAYELNAAIELATARQKAYNRRYFVLLGHGDILITLCKDDIKMYQRRGLMRKGITHLELMDKAIYYTPLSANNNGMTKEERVARKRIYMEHFKKNPQLLK